MRNASIEKKSRNFLPNRIVSSRERLDSKLIQRSKTTRGSGFVNQGLLNFSETIPRDSDPSAALFASLAISGWRRKLVEPIRLPLEEEVSEVPVGSLPRSLAKLLPTYRRLLTANTKSILITCALSVAGLRAE